MKFDQLVSYIAAQPWAVTEERWESMRALIAAAMTGGLTEAEVRDRLTAYQDDEPSRPSPSGAGRQGSIGVIPICGDIVPRSGGFAEYFGIATSCARIAATTRQFAADPNVGTILLDIHSGGGSVYGVHEAYAELVRAREGGTKVVAVVNAFCGSAAYWLAAAAGEIVCAPSGEAGSIGIFGAHMDITGALEKAGVKVTIIKAGKYKAEGDPRVPMTPDAMKAMQARANDYYRMFLADVAAGRGVTSAKVESGYGEGRMLGAREAKAAGLVDRIASMPDTLERLLGRKKSAGGSTASVIEPEIDAAEPIEATPDPESEPVPEPEPETTTAAVPNDIDAQRLELERLELS